MSLFLLHLFFPTPPIPPSSSFSFSTPFLGQTSALSSVLCNIWPQSASKAQRWAADRKGFFSKLDIFLCRPNSLEMQFHVLLCICIYPFIYPAGYFIYTSIFCEFLHTFTTSPSPPFYIFFLQFTGVLYIFHWLNDSWELFQSIKKIRSTHISNSHSFHFSVSKRL